MPVTRNYCLDCEWSVSRENHSREELTRLAIEHSLNCEHDIDSESANRL